MVLPTTPAVAFVFFLTAFWTYQDHTLHLAVLGRHGLMTMDPSVDEADGTHLVFVWITRFFSRHERLGPVGRGCTR